MVRAKFWVHSNLPSSGMDGYTVTLYPVTIGRAENERFYHYTPGGTISLSTINENAAKEFVIGKEFYVDFTPA